MILLKYLYNDFAIQNGQTQSEVKITTKGNNFGHLKIGGLQVVVSFFVTLIDRQSSHG
jgi:hypothetical protein